MRPHRHRQVSGIVSVHPYSCYVWAPSGSNDEEPKTCEESRALQRPFRQDEKLSVLGFSYRPLGVSPLSPDLTPSPIKGRRSEGEGKESLRGGPGAGWSGVVFEETEVPAIAVRQYKRRSPCQGRESSSGAGRRRVRGMTAGGNGLAEWTRSWRSKRGPWAPRACAGRTGAGECKSVQGCVVCSKAVRSNAGIVRGKTGAGSDFRAGPVRRGRGLRCGRDARPMCRGQRRCADVRLNGCGDGRRTRW